MLALILILVITFAIMLYFNVPIAVAIAMSSFFAILSVGLDPTTIIAKNMANGVDSFTLLALPFFILSGVIMGRGGIAASLINFANAAVGWFPGGLAFVNAVTCVLFGAISGSAVAAVSSIGGFMIPEMTKKGYDREFSVAVTATAATTGLLVPPSNIMIIYAVAAGSTSVAAMFMAGVVPGVLIGLSVMVVSAIIALKRGYKAGEMVAAKEVVKSFAMAIPSLLLIFIVIGGILLGWFTATEASAVAVAYSYFLAVCVYKKVKTKEVPDILITTGKTTAIVMLMIGASAAMSWILTSQNIPQSISYFLLGVSDSTIVIFLIINVMLLLVGTFMDMTPAVLIFTPILLPVVEKLGMHPVHFGIMLIANLCIGLCTPPVGSCLFVGCSVGGTSIGKLTRPMIPFFLAMAVSLLLITFVPGLSLWLPKVLGLLK